MSGLENDSLKMLLTKSILEEGNISEIIVEIISRKLQVLKNG